MATPNKPTPGEPAAETPAPEGQTANAAPPLTPTERTLDLYAKGEDGAGGLQKDVKDADTERRVAAEHELAAASAQEFKWCLLQKSQAASREYEGLFNGVTTIARHDALEIDRTIGQYVEQSGKVKAAFNALVQALRATKAAVADVAGTGYQIGELLEDSGTTAADDELNWLKKYVPDFLNRVRSIVGDTGDHNARPPRQARRGRADVTNDLADDAFEVAVKVFGISESVNVASLTPLSRQLVSDVTLLDADVAANVAFAQAQRQEAQLTLTQMLGQQRATRAEKFRKEHQHTALRKALDFVENPGCPPADKLPRTTRERLDQIQAKVEDSYGKG